MQLHLALVIRAIILLLFLSAISLPIYAVQVGPRERVTINDGWRFFAGDKQGAEQVTFADADWRRIDLPHTWNVDDTQDDAPGYRLGIGWYRKVITLDQRLASKRIYLYFEGANQTSDVFVNGQLVGRHKGGYTAFVFDVTPFLKTQTNNQNLIAVKVDNQIDEHVPPSPAADFNLYGGIYRDVWLIATDPVHFKMLDHASSGIYVDTPLVGAESATVRVRGTVTNESPQPRKLRVLNKVIDTTSQIVATVESTLTIAPAGEATFQEVSAPIRNPRLWSPETPYLYSLQTQLYEGETLLDQVTNPVGFRWFSFDPDQGFFLNGSRYKLRGTNRHQDYFGLGNAVPDKLHVKDLEMIKEMGFNCILLAHYPQDPVVLQTADRLGLIVWEELPLVREISTAKEFADNSKLMLTEMIRQHYNHPSIFMWCLMNEIFLKMRSEPGYVREVVKLARELDGLARREDPMRVTVISANRPYDDSDIYNASGLLNIPHVVGWHMYFGWYYGEFSGFGRFLDDEHRRFPKRVLFVSEYGADSDTRLHSLRPMRGDSATEWSRLYHESYLEQIDERPYLGGSAVWAQHDFGSEARGESLPHINTKGLTTFDRRPKDVYYLYKATLSTTPVLHIATHDWLYRTGTSAAVQPINVYTNLPHVELFANNKSLGVKSVGLNRRVRWDVPFTDGLTVLEARGRANGGEFSDRAQVRFVSRPIVLADASFPFRQLAVNVGATAQYTDAAGISWEADQQYMLGEWGCQGGAAAKTNRDILETADDPVYQTARQGITSCRFDVPDGKYELVLRFAEHAVLKPGGRVFSVSVNGKSVISDLDLAKAYGPFRAAARVFQINADNKQGITIEFSSSKGDAVLSGVRLRKLE